MADSIWLLEYLHRDRKNGKWSEWASVDREGAPTSAHRSFPTDQVFSHEKYEKRAIEYVRKPVDADDVAQHLG